MWSYAGPSSIPKLIPGIPRAISGRKSLTTGWRRETSYMSDEVKGRAAPRKSRTSRPLPRLVSYMSAGDEEPGLSKLSAVPTAYAQGSSLQKALGAQQALLLPVGEQEDDVVAERRAGAQGARRLQEAHHAAPVVGGSGGRRHRVVVRDQQQRARRVGAREAGDDVVDGAGDPRVQRRHHLGGLDVR